MIGLRPRHRVAFHNRELLIIAHKPGRSIGFLAIAALLIAAAAVGFDPAADLTPSALPGLLFYAALVLATLGAGCRRHQVRFDARTRTAVERSGFLGLLHDRRRASWDAIVQVTLEWRARPSRLLWAFAPRRPWPTPPARPTAPAASASPAGASPAGASPAGASPASASPASASPASASPASASPASAAPASAAPASAFPAGAAPAGSSPAGALPAGAGPASASPAGAHPAGDPAATGGAALLYLTLAPAGDHWRLDEAAGSDELTALAGAIAAFLAVPLRDQRSS